MPYYILAAQIGMHPVRLSLFLNGHKPLTPELATKIATALEETRAQCRIR